jgi:predicted dinucleotide-binding enzyme
MRDLRQYWQEVRALEHTLPEFVWLMSLEDPKRGMVGGRMAEVGAAQAAQLLHARSHRKATEEEIAAHLEKENQVRRQSVHDGLRRRGIAVVAVPVSETPSADSKRATTRRR